MYNKLTQGLEKYVEYLENYRHVPLLIRNLRIAGRQLQDAIAFNTRGYIEVYSRPKESPF